jgi:D-sedoheptulose 7-phosphate isomerase
MSSNNGNSEGSEYDRLFYPFLFEGGKASPEDVLAQVRHSTIEKCREVVALRKTVLDSYGDRIVAAGVAMAQAFAASATLFAFGNGGSTTDAQDLVADLNNFRFRISDFGFADDKQSEIRNPKSEIGLPAIALTNDIAVVTAVANDVGFDNVFARQIIAFGRPGDIAFGISTSGNSSNVLAALVQAKKQGLLTVALAGYDGGKTARSPAVDHCIVAPSDHIPRIQEAQATVYHALLDVIWNVIHDRT